MDKAKCTEGPLFVDRLSESGNLMIKPAGGQIVAEIDPLPEAEANAAMFAGAPRLFEAARVLLIDAIDRKETHDDDGNEYDDWRELREALEACVEVPQQ